MHGCRISAGGDDTCLGVVSRLEGCWWAGFGGKLDSFFMLSSLGHNHPMAFAAANTAVVACVMAAVGRVKKLTT